MTPLFSPVFTFQSHNGTGQSLRDFVCTWERSPRVGGHGKTPLKMLVKAIYWLELNEQYLLTQFFFSKGKLTAISVYERKEFLPLTQIAIFSAVGYSVTIYEDWLKWTNGKGQIPWNNLLHCVPYQYAPGSWTNEISLWWYANFADLYRVSHCMVYLSSEIKKRKIYICRQTIKIGLLCCRQTELMIIHSTG